MYLDFELCDRNQNVLARLDNRRPGSYVEIGVNAARRAFCPLDLADPALEMAQAVKTVLRVTLRDPSGWSKVLFIGRVVIPEQGQTEEETQLGLNAIDPFLQLERTLIRWANGPSWNPAVFTATDQSMIMWALITLGATHGIVPGSFPPSVSRDRTYVPGKDVGSALVEMTEIIGGPDFELEPFVASDGSLCRFNTFYPRQGTDRSASVRFVQGAPPSTASGFLFAPGGDGMVNRVVVIGAPLNNGSEEEAAPTTVFPGYVAEHQASIGEYGVWEQTVQLEDVTQVATMQAHADAIVAAGAYPIPYFDFTATSEQAEGETGDGVPPRFGLDYWVGDTVGVDFWTPDAVEPLQVAGRITDATVKELESGAIQVKSSCSPSVAADGVFGYPINLLVPEVETATTE